MMKKCAHGLGECEHKMHACRVHQTVSTWALSYTSRGASSYQHHHHPCAQDVLYNNQSSVSNVQRFPSCCRDFYAITYQTKINHLYNKNDPPGCWYKQNLNPNTPSILKKGDNLNFPPIVDNYFSLQDRPINITLAHIQTGLSIAMEHACFCWSTLVHTVRVLPGTCEE